MERENAPQPGITEQTESSDWTSWIFSGHIGEANGFNLERSDFANVPFLHAFSSVPLFLVVFMPDRLFACGRATAMNGSRLSSRWLY